MARAHAEIGKALGRRLAASLGAGAVALSLSEFVFFNEGPVDALRAGLSDPAGLLQVLAEFVLFYAALAYVARVVMWGLRAETTSGLILSGAILGWLIEAVVIPLAYEAPPLSFLWPSLGWHMLVTFGVGWVVLPRILHWPRRSARIAVLGMGGAGWAGWVHLFYAEDPGLVLPGPAEFAAMACITGALSIGGLWLMSRPWAHFRPTRGDGVFAALLTIPPASLMAWSAGPWSLGLLAMVLVTLWAMARLGRGATSDDETRRGPPPWTAFAETAVFPLSAALLFPLFDGVPPGLSFLVVLPLTALATLAWATAVLNGARGKVTPR